jgi:hypothetical protein
MTIGARAMALTSVAKDEITVGKLIGPKINLIMQHKT